MAHAVTVRELRQNLSVYLRRVESGETLSVTRRGEPVAVLSPVSGRASIIDRLAAEGRVVPATARLEDLDPPPPPNLGERSISEALEEEREERLP